jgi:hypothetical protein
MKDCVTALVGGMRRSSVVRVVICIRFLGLTRQIVIRWSEEERYLAVIWEQGLRSLGYGETGLAEDL